MNTTTTTVALSPSHWARRWGMSTANATELLQSMPQNVVAEDEFGRWTLADGFLEQFARPFADLALDDDEHDDDAVGMGGRSTIANDMQTLPRPARSPRARNGNSPVVGGVSHG